MINVLIFAPLALENGRGGEVSAIELAAGLQESHNITLIDTNRFSGRGLLSKEIISIKLKGLTRLFRIRYLNFSILGKRFDVPNPREILKLLRIVKNNEITYFSVSNFKTDLIFMVFGLLLRQTKFIVGYRKPLHSDKLFSLYNVKYRLSILFFSLFKKRFYHHTISYHAKKFLDKFFKPEKVIHIIHGIELDNYHDDTIKNAQEKLRFIYVGYLDDIQKGVGVLLDSIETLLKENNKIQIIFEFCGTGPLESRLRELELKFPNEIKYHGYISNDKISEFYKQSDVFLFSSRREPFGRVIIEALASGLIVICTKTFGSVEILRGKEFSYFLKNLNPEEIKEKILKIYNLWQNNPKRLKELKIMAKEYAFQNFSFKYELEGFKDLITNIVKNKI